MDGESETRPGSVWPCAWRGDRVPVRVLWWRARRLPAPRAPTARSHSVRLTRATRTLLSGSLGAGSGDKAQGRPRAAAWVGDRLCLTLRVGGRKRSLGGRELGAPFPLPPEGRRKRGPVPFGSEPLSPSSALVPEHGVLPYSSQV